MKNDMILLYSTIWRALSVQIDPTDEVATRDAQYMRRSYYQLLGVIANNKLLELWTCIGSENLKVFLSLVVEGAMFVHDPIVSSSGFIPNWNVGECFWLPGKVRGFFKKTKTVKKTI